MKISSCMLAIPKNKQKPKDMKEILDRLNKSNDFDIYDMRFDKETDNYVFALEYEEEQYLVELYLTKKEIPDMCKQSHYLTDEEREQIEDNEYGICIEMKFGQDVMNSYHLQIKLLCTAVPDVVAILDYAGCQVLSGKWASLAASSNVPPAPQYVFSVHAVSDEDDFVWLHSHGLNRCGMPELEILKTNTENYTAENQVLESLATRLVTSEEAPEEKEATYLALLVNDTPLMVTTVGWEESIEYLGGDFVGDNKDRFEGHIENTRGIFVYACEEDYNSGTYKPVSIYDDILNENPLYFVTNSETERMKALAYERLEFVREAARDKDNTVILKLGLTVDEEHKTADNSKEHIWFELQSFEGDTIKALLTQEPYYISGLKEGDEGVYSPEEITDWMIFTPECRINPDSVYLLKTYKA